MSTAMMTVAFSFLFKGLARYRYGGDVLSMPPVFSYPPIEVGGVVVTVQDVIIAGVTLGLVAVFLTTFRFSRFGRIAQAASQAPRGAVLVGINLPALHGAMWGISAALGAVAGILTAPISLIYPDMGGGVLMRAFAAMTLGGFGNFGGAVLGGLLVGIMEQLAGGYISSSLIDIFAYIVIVVVLLVFPSGLFGSKATVRV
jgi:branched-chain amino acid transport system permease protein